MKVGKPLAYFFPLYVLSPSLFYQMRKRAPLSELFYHTKLSFTYRNFAQSVSY